MLSSAEMQAIRAIVVPRNSSLDTSEASFKAKFTLAYKFMLSSTKMQVTPTFFNLAAP